MQEKNSSKILRYFAAANSYNGFVSLFDRVFCSYEFDKIYVLKGGPGTGKSSFMKKVVESYKDKDCSIEEIYCSSDPASLDGVIITRYNKKIAILDGTAPHERDAVVPGTIDEIINLGDGWDCKWLRAKVENITALFKKKSNAYKCAYSYLNIAGAADRLIYNTYALNFDNIEGKSKAVKVLSDASSANLQYDTTRLLSSFGRYGLYRIDRDISSFKSGISVYGDETSAYIFLNKMYEMAKIKSIPVVRYASPLNLSYTEEIDIDDLNIKIQKENFGDINSLDFIKNSKLCIEETKKARVAKKDALEEAQRWFSVASEIHFELENIYGTSMNFSKNEEIFVTKLQEIDNIFQK